MVDKFSKHDENVLYKELSVILVILKIPFESHKELTAQILGQKPNAPYESILKHLFIISEECVYKNLWSNLLNYRKDLIASYGDRVSLHIAAYFLSRDNEAKDKYGLRYIKGSIITAKITMRELKSWWERNDLTGLYQESVITESIDQLCFQYKNSLEQIGILFFKLHTNTGERVQLNQYSQKLIELCRCRDIVGHYYDNTYIIIIPEGGELGLNSVKNRLLDFFVDKSDSFPILHTVSAFCGTNGDDGASIMLHLSRALEKLKTKESNHITCIGKISPFSKWFVNYIQKPFYHYIKHPFELTVILILLIFSIYALNKLNLYLLPQSSWVILNESIFNEQNEIDGWICQIGEKQKPLKQSDGFITLNQNITLSTPRSNAILIPIYTNESDLKIDFSLSLELKAESSFEILDSNNSSIYKININHQSISVETLLGNNIVFNLPYFPANYQKSFSLIFEMNKISLISSDLIKSIEIPKNNRWTYHTLRCSQLIGVSRIRSIRVSAGNYLPLDEKQKTIRADYGESKVIESNIIKHIGLLKKGFITKESIRYILKHFWVSPSYCFELLKEVTKEPFILDELILLSNDKNFDNTVLFLVATAKNKPFDYFKKYYIKNKKIYKINGFSQNNFKEYLLFELNQFQYILYLIRGDHESANYLHERLIKQNMNAEIKEWALNEKQYLK